jgi:hypothetical protein
LAGVQEKSVPIGEVWLVTAHACKKHSACFSLLLDILNHFQGPIGVLSVSSRVLTYGYSVGRAKGNTALAVGAVFVLAANNVVFKIIVMRFVGALVHADFTADTPLLISFH